MPSSAHPVTVVVPVYGDLPSLRECVESLLRNVDQSAHRVLLVNDVGPEADEIEAALLDLIRDEPAFFYERNPRNLGFVSSCNRAALELDTTDNDIMLLNSDTVTTPGFIEELAAVLHDSPTHGAVCPRSNNATIASLPFKLRDPSAGRTPERTAQVWDALKDTLPRFSVAPVAMGFCILMRRELIREYGLFDEVFAPGYGEENDFCLRIREHGFLSLIAHRALVFHMSGRSFVGTRREILRSTHEKILTTRYPYYTDAVRTYIDQERDPVDAFADALVPGDEIVRVLINLDQEKGYRLDARNSELSARANALSSSTIKFTVCVPDRFAFRVSKRFPALGVVRQSRLDGQWDLAIAYEKDLTPTVLARLNQVSPRWYIAGHDMNTPLGFADAAVDSFSASDSLHQIVDQWGRAPVDVARLRGRWHALTTETRYLVAGTPPLESPVMRLLRRVEAITPHSAGWARGVVKRVVRHR